MKKLILLAGFAAVVCSCKKTGQSLSTSTSYKIDTAISVTQPQSTIAGASFGSSNPNYSLLGYGYDVNGRFADSNSVRAQVIDVAAFDRANNNGVNYNTSTSGGQDIIYANDAEDLSAQLSDQLLATKGTKSFKNAIASYFPGATDVFSAKYFYALSSILIQQKRVSINISGMATLQQSLTAAFKQDEATLSAEALVNKYGTHILTDINLGTRVNILYRAQTSANADSKRSAEIEALRFALKRKFALNNGFLDPVDSASLATISNQQFSYYAVGGDRSLIKKLVTATDKRTMINVFDFVQNATPANAAFVNIVKGGLLRLDELVDDSAKKAAVKAYIDSYISNNQVKLVN